MKNEIKDFPANEKASTYTGFRSNVMTDGRIFTTVILVISISLLALILVMAERKKDRDRMEIQTINEKTLKIAPNFPE